MGARMAIVIRSDKQDKTLMVYSHWGAGYKKEIKNALISLSKKETELPEFFGANEIFGGWVFEKTRRGSILRDYFFEELLNENPIFRMVSGKEFKDVVGDEGYVVVNWDTHKGTYGGSWGTYGLSDINKAIAKVSRLEKQNA